MIRLAWSSLSNHASLAWSNKMEGMMATEKATKEDQIWMCSDPSCKEKYTQEQIIGLGNPPRCVLHGEVNVYCNPINTRV